MKFRQDIAVVLVLMLKMSFLGDVIFSYLITLSVSPGANWGNGSANRSTATNVFYWAFSRRKSIGSKFNISILFCSVGINCHLLLGCSQVFLDSKFRSLWRWRTNPTPVVRDQGEKEPFSWCRPAPTPVLTYSPEDWVRTPACGYWQKFSRFCFCFFFS